MGMLKPVAVQSAPKPEAHVTAADLAAARREMSLWLLQTQTRRAEDAARRAAGRVRKITSR